MRLVESQRQKEGVIVLFLQFRDTVIGDGCVRYQFIATIQNSKCDSADAAIVQQATGSVSSFFASCGCPLVFESQSAMP